jgi:hypothetical protein
MTAAATKVGEEIARQKTGAGLAIGGAKA